MRFEAQGQFSYVIKCQMNPGEASETHLNLVLMKIKCISSISLIMLV